MIDDSLVMFALVLMVISIPYGHTFGHSYVIKKDLLSGPYSREFSVYDKTEKILKYRIESRFSFRHNNEIVEYPSKKVVGKLNGRISSMKYVADISLLDPASNQWIDGNITENTTWKMRELMIHWNGKVLTLKSKPDLLPQEFREDNRGEVLAFFKIRPASRLWAARYDMDIYSIKYPKALYFLALAVEELKSTSRRG